MGGFTLPERSGQFPPAERVRNLAAADPETSGEQQAQRRDRVASLQYQQAREREAIWCKPYSDARSDDTQAGNPGCGKLAKACVQPRCISKFTANWQDVRY